VGDIERARSKRSSAPGYEIEVEHPGGPSFSGPAPEILFDGFYRCKHCPGIELSLHEGHGIGEFPSGAAHGRIEDDRGGAEQRELPVQPLDGRSDDFGRAAMATVAPIAAQGDGVEVASRAQNWITRRPCAAFPLSR